MLRPFILMLVLVGVGLPLGSQAVAGDELNVRGLVERGEILPLDTIRSRVIASVRGDYVGFEWDPGTRVYRFRFLVNGSVINVDVDARTGQRLRPARY